MNQPGASNRRYECQVCDEPLDAKSQADLERKRERWAVLSFMHALGEIQILTCPRCGHLGTDAILHGYKKRISSGRDLNYH